MVRRHVLRCPSSPAAARLDLLHVFPSSLLHLGTELPRLLLEAAGFLRRLFEQVAHAPHHFIALIVRIFDYVHGQPLGGLPCVIKDSLQIGRQWISHAGDISI